VIFYVKDNFSNTARDTVTITVTNVNRSPVTSLPSDTVFAEGASIVLPLNITDPDGDPLSITYFEVPPGGSVDSTGAHTLLWNTSYLQAGEYHLRFKATDNIGGVLSFDLTLTISNNNRQPASFNIIFPRQQDEVKPTDYLIWELAHDPDLDDTVSYILDIDDDSTFNSIDIHVGRVNNDTISVNPSVKSGNNRLLPVSFKVNAAETSGEAFVILVSDIPGILSLNDDSLYYWRVSAYDNHGAQTGFTTGNTSFHLNLGNDPPEPPMNGFSPGDGETVRISQPVFRWNPAHDPDYSDNYAKIRYSLELSNSNFSGGLLYRVVTTAGIDTALSPAVFNDNETWYYRLKAYDDDGDSSAYSATMLFYENTIPEPPAEFDLIQPINLFDFFARPDSVYFDWEDSSDPDPGNKFTYRLELSIAGDFAPENIIVYVDSISNATSFYALSSMVLEKEHYYWRVLAIDEDGLSTPSSSIWSFGLITHIGDDPDNSPLPHHFVIEQNYPNPFNNQTVVRYGVRERADVNIAVYSLSGQFVFSESFTNCPPGYHLFRWNGESVSGVKVSSGIYLLAITAGREMKTIKLVLIK